MKLTSYLMIKSRSLSSNYCKKKKENNKRNNHRISQDGNLETINSLQNLKKKISEKVRENITEFPGFVE